MSQTKQTAIDWLYDRLKSNVYTIDELYESAKQMEKEQISEAHYDGYYREDLYDSRNYYNDTYGTKQ